MPRVLYLKQRFFPEPSPLRGIEYVRALMDFGIDLEVLTGFPFYPGQRVYDGYQQKPYAVERVQGVTIHRSPLVTGHTSNGIQRIASYVSFSASATVNALRHVNPPDAVMTTLGPAPFASAASLLARRFGCPLILDVQDLWPESLFASGMWPPWLSSKPIEHLLTQAYSSAASIICLSDGCRDLVIERGANPETTHRVFNWSPQPAQTNSDVNASSALLGSWISRPFLCYTGTLGPLQGIDIMIDAVRETGADCYLVVVGAGRDDDALRRFAAKADGRVLFVGQQSAAIAQEIAKRSLALVLHLGASALDASAIPSKFSAYMGAGKPTIVAAKGESARLAASVDCGPIGLPNNVASMAASFRSVLGADPAQIASWGSNAKRFGEAELSMETNVKRIAEIITWAAA